MPESVRAMVAPPTSSQSFVPFESQVKSTKGCLACLALPCHACRLSQKCSSHVGSPNSDREAGQGRRLSSRRLGSVIRVTLWCFRGFTFFDFGSHRGLRFSKKKVIARHNVLLALIPASACSVVLFLLNRYERLPAVGCFLVRRM